jgi:hypothetical protein
VDAARGDELQPLIVDMIENCEDLSHAMALNSSMMNAARLVG